MNVEPIKSRGETSLLAVSDVAPLHPLDSTSPRVGEVWIIYTRLISSLPI